VRAIVVGASIAGLSKRSPLRFFLLVFLLSIPFWVANAFLDLQFVPGVPFSALGVVCPVAAASILIYREAGIAGVNALWKRAFDWRRVRPRSWFLPTVLLMPFAAVATYLVMAVSGETPLPPDFPIPAAIMMFAVYFVAAECEELGWTGYATDALQVRHSALAGSLVLGLVTAAWHWVPLVQVGRSLEWIAWWTIWVVALRVVLVWIYNNAGKSVFAAALFHATSNMASVTFHPYFDPRITGIVLAVIAVVVVALPKRPERA
jgi:uncharacterized protein